MRIRVIKPCFVWVKLTKYPKYGMARTTFPTKLSDVTGFGSVASFASPFVVI